MRWNIVISLLVLMAAIAPAVWRLGWEPLTRYRGWEVAAETNAGRPVALAAPSERCQNCNLAAADLRGQDLSRRGRAG